MPKITIELLYPILRDVDSYFSKGELSSQQTQRLIQNIADNDGKLLNENSIVKAVKNLRDLKKSKEFKNNIHQIETIIKNFKGLCGAELNRLNTK